jgi:hypothetical protein
MLIRVLLSTGKLITVHYVLPSVDQRLVIFAPPYIIRATNYLHQTSSNSKHCNMTLDILHFIDSKGGNSAEIRDSQRKRGDSVELVDEIIQMYADWVKSALRSSARP